MRKKILPSFTTGFSLIETMVAVTILMLSIVGPLSLAQQGLSASVYAKDQVTAFYLAQDAMEFIRNTRDQNYLSNQPWTNGLTACITRSGDALKKCTVDSISGNNPQVCGGGTCPNLKIETTTARYGYGNGSDWKDTTFGREIVIRELAADELEIAISVTWKTGKYASRIFTVRENILNWGK